MTSPGPTKEVKEIIVKGLKYGDVISLKLDGKRSYISASDRSMPQVRLDELLDGVETPPEVQDCLFQVTQRRQYSAKSAVIRELAKNNLRENLLSERNADGTEEDAEQSIFANVLDKKKRNKLIQLERAYRREQAVNDDEFKQVVGETVMYGQIIQFRHLVTNKFVTIKRTAADVERGALKMVLEDNGAEGSCFQIFSGFRTKPEGSKVMHNEVVSLKSVNFQGNGFHLSSVPISAPSMLPVESHPYVGACWEISAAPEQIALRIIPCTMHPKVLPLLKQKLVGHAYVMIQDLLADSAAVNILDVPAGPKSLCFESPLTRIATTTETMGTDVFRIEPVSMDWSGLPIQHLSRVRIRHVMTSMYLTADGAKAKTVIAAGKVYSKPGGNASSTPARSSASETQRASASPARRPTTAVPTVQDGATAKASPLRPASALPAAGRPPESPPSPTRPKTALPTGRSSGGGSSASFTGTDTSPNRRTISASSGGAVSPLAAAPPAPPKAPAAPAPGPPPLAATAPAGTVAAAGKLPPPAPAAAAGSNKNIARTASGQLTRDTIASLAASGDHETVHHPDMRVALTPLYADPNAVWIVYLFSRDESSVGSHKFYYFFKHETSGCWFSGCGPDVPQPEQDEAGGQDARADQFIPVLHPVKLERNVMVVVRLEDVYTSKVTQVQRWLAPIRHFAQQLAFMGTAAAGPNKLPNEKLMLEVAQNERKIVKVVEVVAKSPMKELYDTRYKTVKNHLLEIYKALDPTQWESSSEPNAFRTYQALARQSGLIECVGNILHDSRVLVFLRVPQLKASQLGKLVVELTRNCHRHLRMVCKENEANQAYVSLRFSGVIMAHLSSPIKAADTLAALYEDNMTQMQTVTADIIHASVELIRQLGNQARYLNFLRQICGTRELPMPNNQNWLLTEIMHKGNVSDIFFEGIAVRGSWVVSVRKGGAVVEQLDCSTCRCPEDLTSKSILEWDVSKDSEDVSPSRLLFLYYCYSLHLIAALCNGRNVLARENILTMSRRNNLGLEFDSLHSAVTNESLPFALRGAMLQVMTALYVDVEPYRTICLPRQIRLMPSVAVVGEADGAVAHTHVPPEITKLQESGLEHLRSMLKISLEQEAKDAETSAAQDDSADTAVAAHEEMLARAAQTVGRNSFTLIILKLFRNMFGLGMLHLKSEVCSDVLETMLQLLRGLDALPLSDSDRFKVSPTSKVVMEAKKVILQTLEFALDLQSEGQCANVFHLFALWQRSPGKINGWSVAKDAERLSGGRAKGPTRMLHNNRVAPEAQSSNDLLHAVGDGFKQVIDVLDGDNGEEGMAEATDSAVKVVESSQKDDFPAFRLDPAGGMHHIDDAKMKECMSYLLDLTRYQDHNLVAKTWQIIERLLSKREKMVASLMRTFVVTDDDLIAISSWADRQITLANEMFNYMASLDDAQRESACKGAMEALEHLSSLMQPMQTLKITMPNEGVERKVFISKTMASNCQYLLHDKQVHLLALKFLRLPLTRKAPASASKLWEAVDSSRRDVFAAALSFLKNFMVVGDDTGSNLLPNAMNQAAILPELPLITSYLDVSGLPVSDALAALFCKSVANAQKVGPAVISKFVKLTVKCGEKRRATWLNLLRKMVVVDDNPIKKNQTAVMQLASQYEEQFLELFASADGSGTSQLRQLLDTEDLVKEQAKAHSQGSALAYHIACVRLISDCCIGKEPELIVKASGYISLEHATDVLLLPPGKSTAVTRRRLLRAYWDLLNQVYYSTDNDNTRAQVRDPKNRMWPAVANEAVDSMMAGNGTVSETMARFLDLPMPSNKDKSGSAASLIDVVMADLETAISEPSDALSKSDSATFYLATHVYPALKEYVANHASSHFNKMARPPTDALQALIDKVARLQQIITDLRSKEAAGSIKMERRAALASSRSLLSALNVLLEGGEAETGGIAAMLASRRMEPSQGPSSLHSSRQAVEAQKVVSRDWMAFVRKTAAGLGVEIDLKNNKASETRSMLTLDGLDMDRVTVLQYSVFKMARLLTGPYNSAIINVTPRMTYEDGVWELCDLLASMHPSVMSGWPMELLVQMIRVVRAALAIDDGHASSAGWFRGWCSMDLIVDDGEIVDQDEPRNDELRAWKQAKYSSLKATMAAVRLLSHPKVEIQMEAFDLLAALLKGGSTVVQTTMFDLLQSMEEVDCAVSQAVFSNIRAGFERCVKWVIKKGRTPGGTKQKAKKHMELKTGVNALLGAKAGNLGAKIALFVKSNATDGASAMKAAAFAGKKAGSTVATATANTTSKTVRLLTPKGDKVRHDSLGDGAGTPLLHVPSDSNQAGAPVVAPHPWDELEPDEPVPILQVPPTSAPVAPPRAPAPPPPAPVPPLFHSDARGQASLPQSPSIESPPSGPTDSSSHSSAAGTADNGSELMEWWSAAEQRGPAAGEAAAGFSSSFSGFGQASGPGLEGSFSNRRGMPLRDDGSASDSESLDLSSAQQRRQRRQEQVALAALCASSDSEDGEEDGRWGDWAGKGGGGGGAGEGGGGGRRGGGSGMGRQALSASTSRRRPLAEATELQSVPSMTVEGNNDEEEDEEELLWEYKETKLNDAEDAHTFCMTMLGCLKNMCEGHHTRMQLLLQCQKHHASLSYDFVVESVELLNVLQDHIQAVLVSSSPSLDLPDLMSAVFDFLNELIMGPCVQNQLALSQTNFLVSCNRIFGYIEHTLPCTPQMAVIRSNIKTKLLTVLLSLLEGVSSHPQSVNGYSNTDVPYRCMDILDFVAIEKQIHKLVTMLGLVEDVEAAFPAHTEVDHVDVNECLRNELLAFTAFIIKLNATAPRRKPAVPFIQKLYLQPHRPDVYYADDIKEQHSFARRFQNFLAQRLGYVELAWNEGVEPHPFVLDDECFEKAGLKVWAKETRKKLQENVSPESRKFPAVKAAELVEVLQEVVEDIELDSFLHSFVWLIPVYFLTKYDSYFFQSTFYLAVSALMVMTLTSGRDHGVLWGPSDFVSHRRENWEPMLLSVMIALQMLSVLLLAISFVATDLYKYINKRREAIELKEKRKALLGEQDTGTLMSWATKQFMRVRKLLVPGDLVGDLQASSEKPMGIGRPPKLAQVGWRDTLSAIAAWFSTAVSVLFFWKFWYICMLVTASFCAFFISPFFLVIHFSIYFVDFEAGQILVEAMARSGAQILNTFVLGILTIFTFAVITYIAFREPLDGDNDIPPPCASFYQCMGVHMLAGLGGDISSLWPQSTIGSVPEAVDQDSILQARSFFVILFFMIWTFVLSNIFVGLIASAFEAIREDKNTILEDSASACLVCSLTMYEFDENTRGGFQEHISVEHNPLHYVYFLHRLRKHEAEDYSGVESSVMAVMDNATTATDKGGWLPVSRSIVLAHAKKDKEASLIQLDDETDMAA